MGRPLEELLKMPGEGCTEMYMGVKASVVVVVMI